MHAVRKHLKRARAALRLLREDVGTEEYRRDNGAIRDATRPLVPIRDACALLQTLGDVDPAGADHDLARRLERRLGAERLSARRGLRAPSLRRSAAALHAVRARVAAPTNRERDPVPPSLGLERAFKKARKAFRRARDESTDARLHEWRKQAQYLAHQMEILEPWIRSRDFAKIRKRAHHLAEALGRDRDLAMLAARIRRFARETAGIRRRETAIAELDKRLGARRDVLRRRAFRLGRRLFRDPPWRKRDLKRL